MKIFASSTRIQQAKRYVYSKAQHIRSSLRNTVIADNFTTNRVEVIPFYNKFLPKLFRKTYKIEYYPDSTIKKSVRKLNSDRIIERIEHYDKNNELTELRVVDKRTNTVYKKEIKNGNVTIYRFLRSKLGENLIYKYEKTANGIINLQAFNPKTGQRLIQHAKPEINSKGHKTKTAKIKFIEIKNSNNSSLRIERDSLDRFTMTIFDGKSKVTSEQVKASFAKRILQQAHAAITTGSNYTVSW